MAVVTGYRGSGNVLSDQLEIDMADQIFFLEREKTQLALLSYGDKGARKQKAINSTFNWLEDDVADRFDAVNGTTGTGEDITVDNGPLFAEHDLWAVTRTKEVMRVRSVSGNVVTFTRGVGEAAVAVADDDELYKIGTAQPEGDTSRQARSENPTKFTNYTQILRNPWAITGTAESTTNETTPHDWHHQAMKQGIEHAKDIELSFLFGKSSLDTSGDEPRRTTKGVQEFISTNVQDAGGTWTETELGTHQRQVGRYGNPRKQVFAAPLAVSVANAFATGKLETRIGEDTYGLKVMTYVSPFGTLDVMTHWLLEGTTYGGYWFTLDMAAVHYRYLAGGVGRIRDTHIATNIQENDRDGRKDEYRSECGLEFGNEKKHGYVYGITG